MIPPLFARMNTFSRKSNLPVHVAVIMDGNGRWAKKHSLSRTRGHLEGIKRVEEIVEAAAQRSISYLTLYTFSTENWRRPQGEVNMLMRALTRFLNEKIDKIDQNNIRLRFIGQRNGIPAVVKKTIEFAEKRTNDNSGLNVNVAFNYGSRREICDAVRTIAQEIKQGGIKIEDINEELISSQLYTQGMPDPDLLIRTSGEYRISNFLLWQLSYSELYFTDKFWPEFKEKDFEKAIEDFNKRERRYGDIQAK